jgi:dihydroneopterin aldolase/2-amino-4-hydroxy-6-hydroxymethyldihydropteridine diphosphokinase
MDQIKIKNLEVFANHGVFPEENVLGQKFLISAVLYTDVRRAGLTDNLSYSIHYGEVSQFINTFMKQHTYKLIEKVAESLAEELLLHTKYLEKIDLEVKKPWAPVGLPVEYVSVSITRKWHTVFIALGSNMGDKQKYLDDAVKQLDNAAGCRVLKTSSWLITAPYGMVDQDDFLNGCLQLKTLLSPEELLELLHKIELDAGRERNIHWGPRTLDLDILYYDELIIESKQLCIPHLEMHKREFVLRPLMEIAPYKHHPILGKTTAEMLAASDC